MIRREQVEMLCMVADRLLQIGKDIGCNDIELQLYVGDEGLPHFSVIVNPGRDERTSYLGEVEGKRFFCWFDKHGLQSKSESEVFKLLAKEAVNDMD